MEKDLLEALRRADALVTELVGLAEKLPGHLRIAADKALEAVWDAAGDLECCRCDHCGKYWPIEDVERYAIPEPDGTPDVMYECGECAAAQLAAYEKAHEQHEAMLAEMYAPLYRELEQQDRDARREAVAELGDPGRLAEWDAGEVDR